MKITKSRLQQIIQEELSYVLMESAEDMYVVRVTSSSPFSGAVTSYWPSNDKPFVGSKAAAEEQVMKAKEGRFSRDWRVVKLDLGSMRTDDPMRAPLADAVKERAHSADNDLDTDNDGMISAGELEKELEDIRDDLLDLSDDLAATFKQHKEDGTDAKGIGDRLAQIAGILGVSRTHAREDVMYSEDYDAVAAFKPDPKKEITLMSDEEVGTLQRGKFFGEDALKVVVTSPSENTMIYVKGP